MKLPAALCYFGILFVALAASGETAGEAEEVATAPLEPLSPDDSFEQQPVARSLRGNIIWELEGDDFRTALTPPGPPTAAPDDSETAGGGVATEKDIWQEESGNFIIWEAEGDDFRTAPTSPPTAAPDDLQYSETADGGEEDAKTKEDISVTQVIPGKCHQANKFWCGSNKDKALCERVGHPKKYCKWCRTCNKCVDKCDFLNEAQCANEKHCKWVK